MNEQNIYGNRTDLILENNKVKNMSITNINQNEFIYKIIHFDNINNHVSIKNLLKQQISFFIKKINLPNNYHVFIVGLGNDNHTADSVGPKTLKHILVNSYLEKLGVSINYPKVSALEPGVLGETGIETKKIIESVVDEIKPDFIILIDSYVSSNINYLNKCIQLTNKGITPGSGLHGLNSEISYKTLGIPVLVIGVPTAIELNFNTNTSKNTYLLSTKDIDTYVNEISKIIGEAINGVLYYK